MKHDSEVMKECLMLAMGQCESMGLKGSDLHLLASAHMLYAVYQAGKVGDMEVIYGHLNNEEVMSMMQKVREEMVQ